MERKLTTCRTNTRGGDRFPSETLSLGELKALLMKHAVEIDGTRASFNEFGRLVEAVLWLAHGRGAAAVVRQGTRP